MSAALELTDPRSFRDVYQAHHGFVWHALHRFGMSGPSLEDALQDVFVVAYRRREDFAGSPKAWLYAIARRVASNHRRAARRRTARTDALTHALSEPRKPVAEAIVALDRYLDALTAEDRELFYLSEVEGMTGPEIAAASGRNLNTVYTRIRKLRTSLRERSVAERARRERPRASARGWAALAPCLQPAAHAVGWVTAVWGAGLIAAAVSVGAFVVHEPADASTVAVTPAASEQGAPPAPPPPNAAAATPPADPDVEEPRVLQPEAPRVTPKRSPPPSPEEPPVSTLAQENTLLEEARAALGRGDAAHALAVVVRHAQAYPDSALADLRSVVRIEALCALGKQPQARAEAKVLLQKRPALAARKRLDASCAQSPDPPGAEQP